MALNIPLPGVPGESFLKGIDTGSTLFTRMMAPILHREAQQRQWMQHQENLALQKQAQARLAAQHAQNYGLQLAAQKRLEQRAADLHRESLRKNDPRYKMEELKSVMDYIRSGALGNQAQAQEQEAGSYMPSIGKNFGQEESYIEGLPQQFGQEESYINPIGMQEQAQDTGIPSAIRPHVGASNVPSIGGHIGQMGSMVPSIGINQPGEEEFIPQLMTEQPAPKSGMKLDKLEEKFLNGWLKKNYGVDFNQLTPEEKIADALEKHKQIREYDIAHPKPGVEKYTGNVGQQVQIEKLEKERGKNDPLVLKLKQDESEKKEHQQKLDEIRKRQISGLKPGEKEFFDPETKEPLGKEINLTAKERESEEGNILFNELFPLVYKGGSPFSGEGGNGKLIHAVKTYKTNPQSRKLVDDLMLANKALAATMVNEASTLKAGRTNRTYAILKESLEAQDIPKTLLKLLKEYKLPSSVSLNAGVRYQKALSDARKKARKYAPATQRLYYNPEMQRKADEEKEQAEEKLGQGLESGGKVDWNNYEVAE